MRSQLLLEVGAAAAVTSPALHERRVGLSAAVARAAVQDHAHGVVPCECASQGLEEIHPGPRDDEKVTGHLAGRGPGAPRNAGDATPFEEAGQREPRLAPTRRAGVADLRGLVTVKAERQTPKRNMHAVHDARRSRRPDHVRSNLL